MRVHNAVLTISCALVAIGCGDSTGPAASANLEHVSMTFCNGDAPNWIAHQDEGGKWTRVNVINGEASFDGTEKQAVAIASTDYGARIQVIYATATALNTLGCYEELDGNKIITGSVAGLGTYGASISLGDASGYAFKDYPSFSLYGVQDGALDLVATRSVGYSSPPDKMIMRRAQNLANNATLSLDFGAAEAFALATHNVSVTGAGSGLVVLGQDLRTANGTRVHLQSFAAGKPAVNLPANKAVAGDLYETAAMTSSSAGMRGVAQFYQDATDRTLAFGPDVPTPTIVSIAGAPYRRMRAEVTAPAEYGAGAAMQWHQYNANVFRSFSIITLKDHFGAMPAKWSFEMPDFTGVEGFQASWALGNGDYEWTVQLIDGTTEAVTEGKTKDGDVLRFAARSSESFAPPQPGAASMRKATSWPRLFGLKK